MTAEIFSLDGRIACVTGASAGIGRAIALALVRAGAAVVGVARREALLEDWLQEAKAAGGRVAAVAADLSDLAALAASAQRISAALGAPDILVNAAGMNPRKPADAVTAEDWQRSGRWI
jgi:gluconate 5-dehydrogenase